MTGKKKYPTGFVPINFRAVGKFLLWLGIVSALLGALDYLITWIKLPKDLLVFGLAAILLSLYVIFVVPKNKD